MNNINYPLTDYFSQSNQRQVIDIYLERSGKLIPSTTVKESLRLFLQGKLGGKIKFLLGLIYFFTLLYFTAELLT